MSCVQIIDKSNVEKVAEALLGFAKDRISSEGVVLLSSFLARNVIKCLYVHYEEETAHPAWTHSVYGLYTLTGWCKKITQIQVMSFN